MFSDEFHLNLCFFLSLADFSFSFFSHSVFCIYILRQLTKSNLWITAKMWSNIHQRFKKKKKQIERERAVDRMSGYFVEIVCQTNRWNENPKYKCAWPNVFPSVAHEKRRPSEMVVCAPVVIERMKLWNSMYFNWCWHSKFCAKQKKTLLFCVWEIRPQYLSHRNDFNIWERIKWQR